MKEVKGREEKRVRVKRGNEVSIRLGFYVFI